MPYNYFPSYPPMYPQQYPIQPTTPMPDQLAQLRQQPQQQVPQVPLQQGQPSTMTGPVFVSGEAGARGFMVAAGNTVMLIDADPDSNVFWLKSADSAGMPSMRTFDYKERINPDKSHLQAAQATQELGAVYTPREDFYALEGRLNALEKELDSMKPKKTKKEEKDDE